MKVVKFLKVEVVIVSLDEKEVIIVLIVEFVLDEFVFMEVIGNEISGVSDVFVYFFEVSKDGMSIIFVFV